MAVNPQSNAPFAAVQLLSRVRFFANLWTAACQASLSFAISQSLLNFISVESVMLSNHLILCYPVPLLPSIFPRIRSFPIYYTLGLLFLCCRSVTQSCPTLCDPMDCSPAGSSVHGIFQARVLEWCYRILILEQSHSSLSGL